MSTDLFRRLALVAVVVLLAAVASQRLNAMFDVHGEYCDVEDRHEVIIERVHTDAIHAEAHALEAEARALVIERNVLEREARDLSREAEQLRSEIRIEVR